MKQRFFTLLLIVAASLSACKKNGLDIGIKEYDEQQIKNYISANGLTGFSRDTPIADTVTGDTSGLYYKILTPPTGAAFDYSDQISLVYTIKSFDGKYISGDTITNHFYDYVGHMATNGLPLGLQTGLKKLLKAKGGSMRLLIPSHLAYGKKGYIVGSVSNTNTNIAGNQCLDYYVHVIDNQAAYDDQVIQNYFKANSLSGYTKTASGLYYKLLVPGTGAIGDINDLSTFVTTYVVTTLNGTEVDATAKTTATTYSPSVTDGLIVGVKEGLKEHATAGTSISLIVPSRLGYGTSAQTNLPSNSVLRFEYQITTVTQGQ